MDSAIQVKPDGTAGGLAIFWKGTSSVTLVKLCPWFIDVSIFNSSLNKSWRLVNVYFSTNDSKMREQWAFFVRYKACLGDDWVLWGDMNDILNPEEKVGGVILPPWSIRKFQSFVDDCGLVDLGFSGYLFTWRNNRPGHEYIQERLDRVLATPSWCLLFNQASVVHLDTVGSDHSALLLNLRAVPPRHRVPFRFDARWIEEDEVQNVINQSWSIPVHGSYAFSMNKKIQACRSSLANWKRRKRIHSGQRIEELKAKIFSVKSSSSGPALAMIQDLKWQLKQEWDKEELFWKQKYSRVNWLRHGDKNTRFFHSSVMRRRAFNRISGIEDSNGVWVDESSNVQAEFKHFFTDLFTASHDPHIAETLESIPHKISTTMNQSLTRPVTDLKIQEALQCMEPTKAPVFQNATFTDIQLDKQTTLIMTP
ncbi:hypothetical protein Vadar_027435 [Vaccinium darrowii]|uniref:Uncharacterized protein n=1 Tax=Vaccinium darrowii TaxID=229202 RepID=A0ACB7Y252_9ERIC|nr:hypothetical protein Vadar_027435 [Vaccinium darrowii]